MRDPPRRHAGAPAFRARGLRVDGDAGAPAYRAGGLIAPARPSPPVADLAMLWDVDAVSATDIWAVGDNYVNPVIEHYDGTAWSLVPTPDAGIAYLRGVQAPASDDV